MIYRFGDCELDLAIRCLLRQGIEVPVEPQVFELLCYLIESRERVVSKDDLIETVWGGRIVSDATLSSRISAARLAVGDSGDKQGVIRTYARRGFRFVADIERMEGAYAQGGAGAGNRDAGEAGSNASDDQVVRFCRSRDGTTIAYSKTGSGYPLVRAGHWMTHLEYDRQSPVWRPFLSALEGRFQLTRYDQRGNGLSDWSLTAPDLDRFVEDLEAVVDAAGLDRFALYGTSQGAPVSVAFAERHPDRVTHLVLHGGFAQGRMVREGAGEREAAEAVLSMIRLGWGRPGSPFLKAFTSLFIPSGTREQIDSLVELQRRTTSPENAAILRVTIDSFDVTPLLSRISVPTLVLHAHDDGVHPIEEGRKLATGIPKAQFITLDSDNHVLLEHEPAREVLLRAVCRFLQTQAI